MQAALAGQLAGWLRVRNHEWEGGPGQQEVWASTEVVLGCMLTVTSQALESGRCKALFLGGGRKG